MDITDVLRDKINSNPQEYTHYRELADVYVDREQFEQAIEVFKEFLKIDDSQGEVYNNIGALYFMLTDLVNAEQYLVNGHIKDPENTDIILNLHEVYMKSHVYDAAIGMLEKYALIINQAEVYKELSDVYKKFGNMEKMMEFEKKYYDLRKE